MTTERHAWASNRRRATSTLRMAPVCACGQDLDVHTGRNCPRCGTSVDRYTARAA